MHGFDLPRHALMLILASATGLTAGAAVAGQQPAEVQAAVATQSATTLAQSDAATDEAVAAARSAASGQQAVTTINDVSSTDSLLPAPQSEREQRAQIERQRRMAQSALNRNHPAEALRLANAALHSSPHDARLLFLKGVALNQLKRLPEAEAVFVGLIDTYPELPEPYNNLAVVRAAQGKLDEAREALEAAIRAVPDYAVAHENLGDLYLRLAERNLKRAAELAPRNVALQKKLDRLNELMQPPAATSSPARPSRSAPQSSTR